MRERSPAVGARTALGIVAGVAAALMAAPASAGEAPQRPALVVLIAVDQLGRDRLSADLPGGLGRLLREGQVHTEAVLDHATTETCPGHAVMLTGRHPGPAGMPVNTWVDPETGEHRYCVEDRAPDAAVLGGDGDPEEGRSPRNLRVEALGDWMQRHDPDARVFAVSPKDRSAITLGGQGPDGVYWLLRDGDAPGFTTSRYYRDSPPDWVEAWNAVGLSNRVPERWEHETAPVGDPPRPDDFDGESDEYSRTSPHPLHDRDPETVADNVYRSPWMDALTLDFALTLVEQEDLGRRGAPDLLAVSLSAMDALGHKYGPGSVESRDALVRLDGWLGEFLDALEERVGEGRLLVALTSDHGVQPLPEWLEATGRLECPAPGGRPGVISLVLGLWWELHWELSPWSLPRPWLVPARQLTVDRAQVRRHDVPVERVVAVAEAWLEEQPSVREVWTREEIASGEGEAARLYRNAFDPERSGDLAIQFEPTCVIDVDSTGTGHGSLYAYDRDVPLVFWGAGVPARRVPGRAASVDVAPSLAVAAGIPVPEGLDGRPLLEPAASRRTLRVRLLRGLHPVQTFPSAPPSAGGPASRE